MKSFRIFLLVLIVIGLGLIFTQKIWVPKLVYRIISSETRQDVTKKIAIPQPFTILIVPGHDTDSGGAKFNGLYERDLVVDVANNISTLLSQDPRYKIIVARDKQAWNPIFAGYFADNKQAILDFKNKSQASYKLLLASGQEKVAPDMGEHTTATQKTAVELYGINKWANVNNVDLIIHLHFNNSKRKNVKVPGLHHGFDMFIPEKQNVNAATSRVIAEDVYNELKKNFTPEAPGYYNSLFEDHSLIALGASKTLTKPAMLIEYGYIYEKILQTSSSKQNAIKQMAGQTVAGIKDYINRASSLN